MTIWFVSDTHFGHHNIIRYCNRPFQNAAEMDEMLIARWNERVKPTDHVYHLGDVAMRQGDLNRVMPQLNGHKRLLGGNHDIFKTALYLKYFEEIKGSRVFDNMIFTHIPIHPLSLGRFRANVHGHIHEKDEFGPRYLNISVERTSYFPLSLEEVRARVDVRLKEASDDESVDDGR